MELILRIITDFGLLVADLLQFKEVVEKEKFLLILLTLVSHYIHLLIILQWLLMELTKVVVLEVIRLVLNQNRKSHHLVLWFIFWAFLSYQRQRYLCLYLSLSALVTTYSFPLNVFLACSPYYKIYFFLLWNN